MGATLRLNRGYFLNQGFKCKLKKRIIFKVTKGVDAYRNEVRMTNGLVQGHAYIVTKAAELEINRKTYRLLRLYNPWVGQILHNKLFLD